MQKSPIDFDTFLSLGIGAVSIAIVYFAFILPAAPATAPQTPGAQAAMTQTHVGRVTGRTNRFSIDIVGVDGKAEPLSNGEPRASFTLSKASDIAVMGWALDSVARKPATRVVAVVDGDVTIGPITMQRPDVATTLHLSPDNALCGYRVVVPTADLAPGRHRIHFLAIGADGTSVLETNTSIEFVRNAR